MARGDIWVEVENLYEEFIGLEVYVRGNETNLSLNEKRGEVETCLLDMKCILQRK